MIESLHARDHRLSHTERQLEVLENGQFKQELLPRFKEKLNVFGFGKIRPLNIEILQINVGYLCNQTCKHCHVDAGPDRKEVMTRDTMQHCLDYIKNNPVNTVDITGGAPEMNPHFRWFINELRKIEVNEIIVRSNLTILVSNKEFSTLPEFFHKNKLRVVSSLPFYSADKTDRQRGEGVFIKSIEALKKLNQLGYGRGSEYILDLVYNPGGAFLPAKQSELERDFKNELKEHFDIDFHSLFTITNLPVSRFLDFLLQTDNYEDYMESLVQAFNPATVESLMCRNTLSIGWNGDLYDCDFNQMLSLKIDHKIRNIKDIGAEDISEREIIVNNHCYGCTAGTGSSCQGTLT